MAVTRIPRKKMKDHFPGLEQSIDVGLSGVGVNVVTATLATNTFTSAANLIAGPTNYSYLPPCAGVAHSLGAPPTAVIPMQIGPKQTSLQEAITYQYCTADNSCVYIFAMSWSAIDAVADSPGVGTRLVIIR